MVDEFFRQIQKSASVENGKPQLLIGHPFLHRLLKDMINAEAARNDTVKLSSSIAKICLRHFDDVITGRGVFIFVELLEHANTKDLVSKQLKAHKADIAKLAKSQPEQAGLQLLLKKISE